ncbi:MAG TPA: ABC transporter substrate-binding protein [Trebonia sp.]|jgi:peptide/nickel transport system substrate-binding protein
MPISRSSRRVAALAAATMAVGVLAACSSSGSGGSSSATSTTAPGSGSTVAAPATTGTSGTPQSGGTLNVVAASGPDHMDTVQAYYTADYELERIYARQLVSYPSEPYDSTSSAAWKTDVTPVADAATEVPTAANGGITDGGKVYTFHIKPGVDWDTTPARQVTADDFIREYKAFFNPVSPVGNPGYFESTISGLTAYANEETAYFANAKKTPPTAANIAKFQDSHDISGIKAVNSSTVQFTLTSAASDFIYMMAMPFASARPVEYDSYVPNSIQLDEHVLSDGPYSESSYVAGKSIAFTKNTAWKQSTDTLRHAYVNGINVTLGVTSAETQLSDIQAGSMDVTNDTGVNPSSIQSLSESKASNFAIWPWSTITYMVFNLRSPNDGGVMSNVGVRQALEYGLDKEASIKSSGGPLVSTLLNGAIPPGNDGFLTTNPYPDNNGTGDETACKNALTKAGYKNGIKITYLYPNDSTNVRLFQAIQASLANCGITLTGKAVPGSSFFVDLGNAPENNKAGTWDMAQAAWIPDWFGNNGRSVIQALFQGPNCVVNTVNYGCYDSSTVNSLITKAEAATTESAATADWTAANTQIMKDAVIIPVFSQTFPQITSKRVRGVLPDGSTYPTALFSPTIGDPDLANIYIASS